MQLLPLCVPLPIDVSVLLIYVFLPPNAFPLQDEDDLLPIDASVLLIYVFLPPNVLLPLCVLRLLPLYVSLLLPPHAFLYLSHWGDFSPSHLTLPP